LFTIKIRSHRKTNSSNCDNLYTEIQIQKVKTIPMLIFVAWHQSKFDTNTFHLDTFYFQIGYSNVMHVWWNKQQHQLRKEIKKEMSTKLFNKMMIRWGSTKEASTLCVFMLINPFHSNSSSSVCRAYLSSIDCILNFDSDVFLSLTCLRPAQLPMYIPFLFDSIKIYILSHPLSHPRWHLLPLFIYFADDKLNLN